MPVDPGLWLAFVVASAVLAAIPGPIVMLVVANSLAHGSAQGLRTLLGTASGTAVLFVAGGLGMTWVLAFLADWFEAIRWAGAAYLVWMGIRTWRSAPSELAAASSGAKRSVSFVQGFVIGVTNPKTLVFYAAFFPQFMDPALPAGPQIAALSMTFLAVATAIDALWALLSGRLRPWLTGERRGLRELTRTLLVRERSARQVGQTALAAADRNVRTRLQKAV